MDVNKIIKEEIENIDEDGERILPSRVLSTNSILSKYSSDLKEILLNISRKEKVDIRSAALSLANILSHTTNIKDLNI